MLDFAHDITQPIEPARPPAEVEIVGRVLRAAWLMADGRMTDAAIMAELGLKSRQLLVQWRRLPAFQAKVKEYRAEIDARILSFGEALRENRIREQVERLRRMKALLEARQEAGERRAQRNGGDVGEETGLLAEIPAGKTTIMAFDANLVREIRELEKQIAQELGQFQQKMDVTSGGEAISFTIPMSDTPGAGGE